ncbi:NAD(P)/FAD-dependent oxidoreductase [Roseovarius sp. 217]|uniref:NAD(P)/FAD-dependent oxidoreductase n=1 Tax=Roseovarius sp. (strain 217) TaxID=314264 RepID=UPI0000687465|nr:FAD-dependent oxidoreductase [Roseovarius sp. 217]EAQ25040.1 Putative cyclopropane/cyclopropene fatty acid synthesis protein, flavin amine oxidase [Roseovarius sp. 217]
MPFETGAAVRKKIAVIGAGITGMGAADRLADGHHVVVFEAEPRLGGHARTIMAGKRGDQPVDTGFIVFNYATYPNLNALFERLDVPVAPSTMSFGASFRGGALEYGLQGAGAFFAQRRNVMNPAHWMMLRDIFRFNEGALEACKEPGLTMAGLITKMQLGCSFRDYYLTPFSGAIWSMPVERVLEFPAQALVTFFKQHGLLGYSEQHQWYTVVGGSVAYVSLLERSLRSKGAEIRLGAPIAGIRRLAEGVEVRAEGGDWEQFDEVVIAAHSDDALRLLADADESERGSVGAIAYQPNDIILHADTSVMPRRRAVWSSWNYTEARVKRAGQIDLTYWMNSLQPIPEDDPHFVTLNTTRPIRDELIYDQVTLRHPVYDLGAVAAQARVRAMNGRRNTWFCGAWMRNGFHEDGLASGLEVAEAIYARAASAVAAE